MEARRLFAWAHRYGGDVKAGISAANMALKLGDTTTALAEYRALLDERLPRELREKVEAKCREARTRKNCCAVTRRRTRWARRAHVRKPS